MFKRILQALRLTPRTKIDLLLNKKGKCVYLIERVDICFNPIECRGCPFNNHVTYIVLLDQLKELENGNSKVSPS